MKKEMHRDFAITAGKKLFSIAFAGILILAIAGCISQKPAANNKGNIVAVSQEMVHSNQFQLAWDSPYEHLTNIFIHGDGTKTISVSRDTNIVYNIYMSQSPIVPIAKWQRVATVDTTAYTCFVTNFPEYFTVRTMDLRTKWESPPAR